MVTFDQRFWSKVRLLPTGCLLWGASLSPSGYGNFTALLDGQKVSTAAHRWAWYLEHGYFPVKPMVLDHMCGNRWCVNVTHLQEISFSENLRLGTDHRRSGMCKKGLHPWVPSNMEKATGGMRCIECRRIQQRNYRKKF